MCEMMYYTVSDKKLVTDAIHVRLVSYWTHDYPYLYIKISVLVFISEDIRIRSEKMKTNIVLVISVLIRSHYTSNY